MIPKDTDSHYRLTLEFDFRCPESDEHYWKAVIAFLVQKHLNMELMIPSCKLETYRTSPVYKLVTAASEQWDMKPLNPRPHVDTVDGCPDKPAAAPDADLSLLTQRVYAGKQSQGGVPANAAEYCCCQDTCARCGKLKLPGHFHA